MINFEAIEEKIEQPKYIYCFKYKKLGVYSLPVFANEKPLQRASVIKRGLAMDPKLYDDCKGTEYYCIGVFDDATGNIIPANDLLLDIDAVFELTKDLLGLKEVDNGKQKEA